MQKEKTLLFRGSKERLKRNVARYGGTFPESQCFEIVWRSKYFRRGLAYRFYCRYEKANEAYRIKYICKPTMGTLIWIILPTGGLLAFALWECLAGYYDSAVSVSLFSVLYPGLAIWQWHSCRKEFCKAFSVATGNKVE